MCFTSVEFDGHLIDSFDINRFATFIVTERESKAKHLQTVAGVKPEAYWLSTLLWDFVNSCLPAIITIILCFAFDISSLTTTDNGVLGAFILLLFLFGPAAAAFSYCVTFLFKSASLCKFVLFCFVRRGIGRRSSSSLLKIHLLISGNIVLIVSGFLLSMGGSIST